MKYASHKEYGGQKASIGRTVLMLKRTKGEVLIFAGHIAEIHEDETVSIEKDHESYVMPYHDVKTQEDIYKVEDAGWCWPPKV